MIRRKLLVLGTAICLAVSANAITSFADTTSASTTTMENCGAYLFEWRPIDCGNGNYFAILVGGNTLNESNVILNRGYDYAYTFEPMTYSRPWGTVPDLVNIDGKWGIPENWSSMPEGAQPTLQIVLKTNYKTLNTDKRYVNVVHLPSNVNSSTLPAEVRKYLINVDASDAGAYNDTVTPGWQKEADGSEKYLKPDGTYVSNGWLQLDDKKYYMDENGVKLKDTITPDGFYVNSDGEKVSYMPGWYKDGDYWRYIQKNGYYLANSWYQDTDGKYYYLQPVYDDKGIIYSPVDSKKVSMRTIITKEEAQTFLERARNCKSDELLNQKITPNQYDEMVKSQDTEKLMHLVRFLYDIKNERAKELRKMKSADSRMLVTARKLLYGELAVALGKDYSEMSDLLDQYLGQN